MSKATFVGTCVGLRAGDLRAFDDSADDITYQTFRRHVGGAATKEINAWAGWPGTHFSDDQNVRFSKGLWKGRPAVCMLHSSIHHIWTIRC